MEGGWSVRQRVHYLLGGFHQVIDVDMKVIIIFDIVDRGLGWDLVDDQAGSLHTLVCNVLHLLPHQTLRLFSGLPVRRQQVLVFWGVEQQNIRTLEH